MFLGLVATLDHEIVGLLTSNVWRRSSRIVDVELHQPLAVGGCNVLPRPSLTSKLHVLCLVVTGKSDVVGSNIQWDSALHISSRDISNATLDVRWQTWHPKVSSPISTELAGLSVW